MDSSDQNNLYFKDQHKNAFQWDAYRPLQWPSLGGGGVLSAWGEGVCPRGVYTSAPDRMKDACENILNFLSATTVADGKNNSHCCITYLVVVRTWFHRRRTLRGTRARPPRAPCTCGRTRTWGVPRGT